MTRHLKHVFLTLLFISISTVSCTKVFTDDDLDFMWRLDKVEYPDGRDFDGNVCSMEPKDSIWFSFARDLIEICLQQPQGPIGIMTRISDSIFIDYSIYIGASDYNQDELLSRLRKCGIPSLKSSFRIDLPDRKSLVLSGDRSVLFLTKW